MNFQSILLRYYKWRKTWRSILNLLNLLEEPLKYTRYLDIGWEKGKPPINWILVCELIEFPRQEEIAFDFIEGWLKSNSEDMWTAIFIDGNIRIYVENEDDSVMLKLIWPN